MNEIWLSGIGILLALAHEASGRLWVGVAMHMVFNLMAVLVPARASETLPLDSSCVSADLTTPALALACA